MEFRILGPLEVESEAGPVALPRGRGRALLALLVLRAGEVVPTERLIDELWGHRPPPTAATALHGLVADLRRRLEPGRRPGQAPAVLKTRPPGYVLAIDRGQVDAHRFRHLVEAAAGTPPQQRAALLREALALWRGPALAEFTYEPFAQAALTMLSELRLTAVEERIDAELACGGHAALVGELEGLVAEHPLRERLRAQLMLALYRCGRQAEALDVYADARRTLVDELGIEPGPALRTLEEAVLRQDGTLELQPAAPDDGRAPAEAAARPWLGQARKTVTVVFVDLAATAAGDGSDPEALRRDSTRGAEIAGEVLGGHGGEVEGVIGDVLVAVFGVPVAHEDDALRAVRAAAELRTALAALNAELARERRTRLAARIGVNTGEVLVGDPAASATASGDTVNVAARLQQAAGDGEALIGEATVALVEDGVVVEPLAAPPRPGGSAPPAAWRLVDVVAEAPARPLRLDTPLVGRETELEWLRAAFTRAVQEQRADLVTVVGEAGLGKTRLALELADAVEARVLTGRCPPYGEGITYWPLRELVLAATGGEDVTGIAARDVAGGAALAADVADAVGLGAGDSSGAADLFPAVRRFVEALAHEQPLIMVIDDAHWAQPAFLALVDYLAEAVRGPVLLLCLARPELLERWRVAAVLRLEPLGPDASGALVAQRLAGRTPAETVAQIVETAQGNPLFLEQLAAALRDERELALPPTLRVLLAARLDRLGPAERDLLRCASVIGVDFSPAALAALVPDEARPFLERHLHTLERKELLRPARRPANAMSFRHVLIQHAAYRSMTRETRADLHERLAAWLETDAGPLATEEVIGYHLEQSHRHRREVGLAGARTDALAVRAGGHLARAGLLAHRRLDIAGAVQLLARAQVLLPPDHPERRDVLIHLAEGYPVLGRHADAERVLADLLEELASTSERRLELLLRLERARVRLWLGPDPVSLDALRADAARALEAFEAADDLTGIAKASFVLGLVCRREGAVSAFAAHARHGLTAAQRAGNTREEAGARWNLAWAAQAGRTPVPEAIRLCEELAPIGDTLHPGVLCELAVLRAMAGELDGAREVAARARRLMLERWRQRGPLMYPLVARARVAMLAGDPALAERELRTALELAVEMGVRDHVAQLAAALARVHTALGNAPEAARCAATSAEAAPAESVAAQALWRAAAALVKTHRAEHREAVRLARAAVELAPPEMLNLRAELHAVLAGALAPSGEQQAARAALGEAASLYERKGNVVEAARARVRAA